MRPSDHCLLDHIIGKNVFLLQRALPCIAFAEYRYWEMNRGIAMHRHPALFQLDYFPDGDGVYRGKEFSQPIKPDLVFFMAPGGAHAIRSSAKRPLVNLTVKFRHPCLDRQFLPALMKMAPGVSGQIAELMRQVVSKTVTNTTANKYIASLRLAELLVFLYQTHRETRLSRVANPIVARVIRCLLAHFNEPLSLTYLAQVAGVTEEHLCRIFKKETGGSPLEFLQLLRLEHAKMRLCGADGNISDIAAMTGFGKSSDMNRCFRKHLGMSSREYRQKTWKK